MKYPIRSMFIPSKGKTFLAFDFSAAESWVVAYLSKSETLKYALHSPQGFHMVTAEFLFDKSYIEITKDERYIAKKCNHGLAYRMGPFKLAESINDEADVTGISVSRSRAKYFHTKWHELYNLKAWWSTIDAELYSTRTLVTPYGRKRTFMGQFNEALSREATAFVPQSTVGEHCLGRVQRELGIRGGMLEVRKMLNETPELNTKIIHTAYDSCMLEVPHSQLDFMAKEVRRLLLRPILIHHEELTIPVDCDIGDRWGELIKYKIAA
jgi:DNA polymerase I-like protein with 3'-5' exonuclease and polymerase domains